MSDKHRGDAMGGRVRDWLHDSDPNVDVDGQVNKVLASLDETPQVRRGFLWRWVDRPDAGEPLAGLTVGAAGVIATIAILLLGTLLLGTSQAPTDPGTPVTRTVAADGSGDHAFLADAVAAASDGDSIVVMPGTYAGGVIVDKDVHIAGTGPREDVVVSVTEGGPSGTVSVGGGSQTVAYGLWLTSNSPSVSDVTFEAAGDVVGVLATSGSPLLERITFTSVGAEEREPGKAGYVALLLAGETSPVVRDSTWDGYAAIREGAAPTFDGNTIVGSTLSVDGPGETIITDNTFLEGGSMSTSWGAIALVEGNRFTDGGIGVDTGSTAIVRGNVLTGFGEQASIYVADPGTRATVEGNAVLEALTAVSVGEGTKADVRDNEISGSQTGIMVARADPTIEGNVIEGPGSGILVVSGGSPTIIGNDIDVAGRGISVGAGSQPTIARNDVCGSTDSIHVAEDAAPTIGTNELCEEAAAG